MVSVNLYSNNTKEIEKFLSYFYETSFDIKNNLKWEHEFTNPIELADIIAAFIDNKEDFEITMWISLDKNIFINITEKNADILIKYLFERYPY